MHNMSRVFGRTELRITSIAVLVGLIVTTAYQPGRAKTIPMTVRGVVAGTYFVAPSGATPSSTSPSYYQNAKVCVDENSNGVCDPDETGTMTGDAGEFFLHSLKSGPLVAEVSTTSTNSGHAVAERVVFRAAFDQIAEGAVNAGHAAVPTPAAADVVITPLSTEVVRMMEADNLDYQTAKWNLSRRLNVSVDQVVSDPANVTYVPFRHSILSESVILTKRFALAARMVDRHDVSPAALALNSSATSPAITMKEAFQASMNLESIPRYDHIFIIVLENKATASIKGSPFAPKINGYLNSGNQFTSYYATGNPSEPNRIAVAAADDFGVTDDNAINCIPAGDTPDAMEDLPLPAGMVPCTQATNHNIKNRQNLFNALTAGGMSWRVYSESINPHRDVRLDGIADPAVVAKDHVYQTTDPVGAIGNANLQIPFPAALYRPKHNESVNLQNVRSAPEFFSSNRTMGGGQWDDALKAAYPDWNVDQFGDDLMSGDIGQVNFLEPDQCDDMHNITVQGTVPPNTTKINASDCSGNAIIFRGDNYTDALIKKIQASPIWTNPQKRSAIVISFDEGTATSGFNSCCGWNPVGKPGYSVIGPLGVLLKNPDGTTSADTSIVNYAAGNKGHGASIFGVLTNQSNAPKGVVDSDAYSHIAFVRTLQDMFGIADPGDDWSYMNRSKYTETFIAHHLPLLPEFSVSPDRHFDAVRPMNHSYVIPAGYIQKNGFPTPQVGPDANQINAWSLK
jgi:hypothetical protein